MVIVNFSHPLTKTQQEQIEKLSGQSITAIHNLPSQLDNGRSFAQQVAAEVDVIGLSAQEWQTLPLLINPPAFAPITAVLIAELHGRMGYFPTLIRIRPVTGTTPSQFEVAELLNLQTIRDQARRRRVGHTDD